MRSSRQAANKLVVCHPHDTIHSRSYYQESAPSYAQNRTHKISTSCRTTRWILGTLQRESRSEHLLRSPWFLCVPKPPGALIQTDYMLVQTHDVGTTIDYVNNQLRLTEDATTTLVRDVITHKSRDRHCSHVRQPSLHVTLSVCKETT